MRFIQGRQLGRPSACEGLADADNSVRSVVVWRQAHSRPAKLPLLFLPQACTGIPVLTLCGFGKAVLCLAFLIYQLDKIRPDTVGKLKWDNGVVAQFLAHSGTKWLTLVQDACPLDLHATSSETDVFNRIVPFSERPPLAPLSKRPTPFQLFVPVPLPYFISD